VRHFEPDLDEDSWSVPPAWWDQAEPFRGRGPERSIAVDATAPGVVAELLANAGPRLKRTLDASRSDAELVERARLFLGTPAAALAACPPGDPALGAAVFGAVLCATTDWQHRDRQPAIVDDWVASHGIVFVAEAGVLMAGIRVFDPTRPAGYPDLDLIVDRAQWLIDAYRVRPLLIRLRALLAATDEASYAEAVSRLTQHRSGSLGVRLATSYLLPTEQHWLDEDIAVIRTLNASQHLLLPLLESATTEGQAMAIIDATGLSAAVERSESMYSMGAHIGPAVAPVLARVFDNLGTWAKTQAVSMLGQLPTDAAFDLLLDRLDQKHVQPVVLEAMRRFPRRAMRLLAVAATGAGAKATIAKDLLRGHAVSHRGLVERIRPALRGAAGQALDKVVAAAALPVAAPDQLPTLLVTPPWTGRRARPKHVVVQHLGPSSPLRLAWRTGEREEWARTNIGHHWLVSNADDWRNLIRKAFTGEGWGGWIGMLALAPPELVHPYLHDAAAPYAWDAEPELRRILGRLGDDAVDYVRRVVLTNPTAVAAALMPVEGSEIAAQMATWYRRSTSIRPIAVSWFDRHATTAARDLIPLALANPGPDRSAAEAALRLLDQWGHRDAIRAGAQGHGPEVVEAIEAVLAVDPLQLLPARLPALPAWLDLAHLPQVLLPDRSAALPVAAVGHICTMFAISRPDDVYAGIDVVRDAVDPHSLAEMAWGLFERWRGAAFPIKDGWVLRALGLVGDDETVRRLAPLIRAWPGEGGNARAVAGLDVLSEIGSHVALMHLHGIAQRAKFTGLKTKARAKMAAVADNLGLTADQLADRLVPDFGLDDQRSLLLDYGNRRFRVGFDEQLKPTVADEDGVRRKVLPKPGAKDDPALGHAAYARFSGLKKDVKTVAADQIRRFEHAMVAGRRWTAAEQRALFVEHPLLWHLARRLVWGVFGPREEPLGSFRVTEDRSLAGSDDAEIAVPDQTVVGIAHPLHLGDALGAWSDVFADYEILQPFDQLGREVLRLTDAERAAKRLDRFVGAKVPIGRVLGLSHRGWERGMPQDAGIQVETYKPVAGGRAVVIDLDPGIIAGDAMEWAEQTIAGVWLNDGPADWGNAKGNLSFGLLDPITASEALRDIESLCR